MRYSKEWEHSVTRLGRWIDFENDYKTLNLSYGKKIFLFLVFCLELC